LVRVQAVEDFLGRPQDGIGVFHRVSGCGRWVATTQSAGSW
jgi:hypothetical protein